MKQISPSGACRLLNTILPPMPQKNKKPVEYPKETRGSKVAAEIRKKANSLTDDARDDLFQCGMQIIYGAAGKAKAARTRH